MCVLPYQNYIFDLYGTLVDIHTDEELLAAWEALARFYRYYGAVYAPAELRAAYRRLTEARVAAAGPSLRRDSHEAYPEIELGQVFLDLFTRKGAADDRTLAVHAGQFFRAMTTSRLQLYAGALEMLAGLRRQGGRLYLLSNAQAIFTAYEMRALGLDGAFDAVYLSSDYGCKKPDTRFFRILLEEQGLDPARSIMAGNNAACDIAGAKAAGLATLYVRSNISPGEPLPDADFVLPAMDMAQMGALLAGQGILRPMVPEDLDQVAALWLAANLDAHGFVPAGYWQSMAGPVRPMLTAAEIYLWQESRQVLGFIGLGNASDDSDVKEVAGLFVDRAARGRGIGRRLLSHAKTLYPRLQLHVYQKNGRAAAFYRREGFAALSAGLDSVTGEADWLMEWRAGAAI